MQNDRIQQIWGEITNLLSIIYAGDDEGRNQYAEAIRKTISIQADDEQKMAYLEGVRDDLAREVKELKKFETPPTQASSDSKPRRNLWPLVVGLVTLLLVATIGITIFSNLGGKSKAATTSSSAKTSLVASSNENSKDKTQDGKELEGFEVLPYGENTQGKVIPNGSSADSLTGDEAEKLRTVLANAAHRPQALENYARQWQVEIPKDIEWAQEVNGKKYLSKQAQDIYFRLEAAVLSQSNIQSVERMGVTGYMSGVSNGELVQNTNAQDYSNWSGLKVVYQGYVFYIADYCGNTVTKVQTPGVKVKELPIPPEQPRKKTPPSSTPPSTTVEPKKAQQDPVQQGNANVGGGQNASTSVSEAPSETPPSFTQSYSAPQAPSASATQPSISSSSNVGGGAGSSSSSANTGISNSNQGSFSDANGQTNVSQNGAVETPSTSYGALVNQTPPPVQNGSTSNSGVNNGYQSGNDIPMDD